MKAGRKLALWGTKSAIIGVVQLTAIRNSIQASIEVSHPEFQSIVPGNVGSNDEVNCVDVDPNLQEVTNPQFPRTQIVNLRLREFSPRLKTS